MGEQSDKKSKSHEFKRPPRKYMPKGLNILYEDGDLLVVDKDVGLLSVGTDREKEKTAYFLLNEYVKKGNVKSKNRVFIVHRLDRDTSGVLVFAKSEKNKNFLQENWKDFGKTYFAIAHGKLKEKEGIFSSYLTENKAFKVYSTKDKNKGKLSETAYKVVKEYGNLSLLEIQLLTGRKNQIRVHLAEAGNPVLGDRMYGKQEKGIKRLGLHAASLHLIHPFRKEPMTFESELPFFFKSLFKMK
jgi:RluA family pseudouridine synthase